MENSFYKESLKKYLDDLASNKPAPGGGSAAALTAATGAALISMVANFTVGKEKYKSVEGEIKGVLSQAESLRQKLMNLVDEDVAAYKKISAAFKLPKDNPEDKRKRSEAIQQALKEVLVPPLEVCKCCQKASELCTVLAEKGNLNLISDVGVAVSLLDSAFQSALLNVEINLKSIKDETFILQIRKILEPMEKKIPVIKEEVENEVAKHLGGSR